MWWKSKDDDGSSKSASNRNSSDPLKIPRGLGSSSRNNNKSNGLSSRRRARGNRSNEKDDPMAPRTPVSASASTMEENEMYIGETLSGIEVSLSQEIDSPPPSQQPYLPLQASLLVSFTGSLAKRRQRVHRSQYDNSRWPLYKNPQDSFPCSPVGADKSTQVQPRAVRPHRVPLSGRPSSISTMPYDDILFLLKSHEVVDEVSCVREELTQMNAEIEALEEDRGFLEEKRLQLPGVPDREGGVNSSKSNAWDVHCLLSTSRLPKLSAAVRDELQEHRGLSLTVCMHNEKAQEAFLSKCGYAAVNPQRYRNQTRGTAVVTLDPDNCRDGGAAATIQHVSLLKGSSETSFFISRDSGKACHWGHLPEKLFRRMKSAGLNPQRSLSDLVYLSTGPLESYYAELRSGECWWGSPLGDEDFHSICSEWDVFRVAFGSTTAVDAKHTITSWIILGRDGRAAWKNLPARLHSKLESRMANEAAPVEVSLGSGDSYFIRFLDGSFDFCLPATAAEVCRKLEQKGVGITSVSLHPELSHDFVIRHGSGR
jgi:hypothetical protein